MSEEEYKSLLKQHDWHFQYSDDQRVWRRGYQFQCRLEKLAQTYGYGKLLAAAMKEAHS